MLLSFPTTQVTMCYNIFVLRFRFSLQWSYMGSKHQGRGTGLGLWWSSYVFSSKFKLCWLAFPKQCQKNKIFLWHMAMWTTSNHQECWQWAVWRYHWSLQVWTRYDKNIIWVRGNFTGWSFKGFKVISPLFECAKQSEIVFLFLRKRQMIFSLKILILKLLNIFGWFKQSTYWYE